jgi:AcrR family transcriptional regulator
METPTVNKPRRPEDSARWEKRQEEILEAAGKLFAEHGYSQTDTQMLADQLHVGKGTLYRYFPSKEALFLAAADLAMRKVRKEVDASMVGIEDPLDQIAAAVRTFLTFCAEHPEFVELLMQERAQFKDRKKPTYFVHQEANIERWRNRYRALIAQGKVRDMPVERITSVISELLYGAIFTNYFSGQKKSPEAQARDILDVFYHGILSDSERRRRADRDSKA